MLLIGLLTLYPLFHQIEDLFYMGYFGFERQANRRDGVVVRASASQSVDLEFISQVKSYQKWYSELPCSALSTTGIVWRTSRQACLLCPWARHLTGCFLLYVSDRWCGQAVYPSWWPSVTEDLHAKRECYRSMAYMYIFLHKFTTNSSNDEEEER